jgi:hypothetical protein
MNTIGTIHNILPAEQADTIETTVTDNKFPWFWSPSTKYGIHAGTEEVEDFQFVHMVYYDGAPQSELFLYVRNIIFEVEKQLNITVKDISKIKVNLLPKQPLSDEDLKKTIHTDKYIEGFLTVIYYVSDCDGDTIIYNPDIGETRCVTPEKNKIVYFPSHLEHRATPPADNKRRLVINMVLDIRQG